MVERFFILISLYLGGIHLGESTTFPAASALLSEFETGILSNSVSEAIQLNDCGVGCDMLIQKSQDIKSEELDKLIAELLEHYGSVYHQSEAIYFTLKHLKEEVKYEEDILAKMNAVKFQQDTGYYGGMIKDLEDQIAKHGDSLEKMETDHLVMVVEKGQQSYISTEDYKYLLRKSKLVKNAESFIKENMNSAQLYDLHDSLLTLQSELRTDDSCSLLSVQYSYNDLVTYTDSILDLAKETEHQEKLLNAAENIAILYSSAGQYWLKSEVKDFLDSWDQMVKILKDGETVSIMGVDFDLPSSKEKYYELKGIYQKLHIGEVATFTDSGDLQVVVTPLVKTSDAMKGSDYFDLIKSAASRKKHVPIVSTDQVFTQLSGASGSLTKFDGLSAPATFLQTADAQPDESLHRNLKYAPLQSDDKGNEYQDGALSLILITTFLSNATGTGKVIAFDAANPENYVELLNGFEKPTGVCFDVNHNFLYVVESDGADSGIYQFQVERKEFSMKFANDVFVVVYYGNPQDCKVDSNGNLFFTEKKDQSIKKMTYSDLYFGYTNTEVSIYSYTFGLDYPTALELVKSSDVYFVNSGNSTNDGSINIANVLIDEEHPKDIDILIQEKASAVSLTVTDSRIFYSLKNGAIKSYSKKTKDIFTYSRELEQPAGVCSSNGKIFALDYSQGTVFVGKDDFTEDMEVFLYVQAPYSCFCLNFKESSSSFAGFLVVGLVFMFVF